MAYGSDIPLDERFKLRREVETFLNYEAELLDDYKLEEWLDLLTDDAEYIMPVRSTRERGSGQSEFNSTLSHFDDTKEVLESRVERFTKEYAWTENPRRRTRRIVGNVRIVDRGDDEGTIEEVNNLLVSISREDQQTPVHISAERHDTLRRNSEELKLAKREVLLDHTVVQTLSTLF